MSVADINKEKDLVSIAANPAAERISANFARFEAHLRQAQEYFAKDNLEAAAVNAALAAHVATSTHCGIFWSPRLERLLNAIGRGIEDSDPRIARGASKEPYRRVLHVATQLHLSGGVTRMISRWISADKGRANSIAVTQHRGAIPEHISTAVAQSGGRLYRINRHAGGILTWVKELRRLAREFDVIILHIHCEDVVPLLAFATPADFPPVLLLNHADHLFWLGPSISHAVLSLRDAAKDIAGARRGIDPARNLLIPTIVDDTTRVRSRSEAKRALGFDPNRIILTSVARAAKYRTTGGVTYADLHVPLLLKHPNAELIVVGVHSPRDWASAIAAVDGRIHPLPNQDPRPYYEAADIYVDSYPFVSSTSMMEAAGYGLPLVTIFKAPTAARIIGINHVGLIGTVLATRSDAEYIETVSRLITDETYRAQRGEAARDSVTKINTPSGWLPSLEAIYARSRELPPLDNSGMLRIDLVEQPFYGEPDSRHEEIFKANYPISGHLKGYMGMVSWRQQRAYWQELRRDGAFENWREASTHLLPEWMKRVLKDRTSVSS